MAQHPDLGYFDEGADLTDAGLYQSARRPFGQASLLPALTFRSKVFSALEDEKIWSRGWVAIGVLPDIPEAGDLLPFTVGNHGIHVQRNDDGGLTGRFNKAQHGGCRAVPLQCQTGSKTKCSFTSCGFSRDRDVIPAGDLADGAPAMHQYLGLVPERLLPVKIETFGPLIFANLDPGSDSLRHTLGDLPSRIGDPLGSANALCCKSWLDIRANWKLAGTDLFESHSPMSSTVPAQAMSFDGDRNGPYVLETLPLNNGRVSHARNFDLPALPGFSSDHEGQAVFCRAFPNLLLALLPSHVVSIIVQPLSMTETRLRISLLAGEAHGRDAAAEARRLHDSWNAAIQCNAARIESLQDFVGTWGTASRPESEGATLPVEVYPERYEFQQFLIGRILEKHMHYWNAPLYGRVSSAV